MSTDLSVVREQINQQLTDPVVVESLLANVFKGLTLPVAKQAMLEALIRGFKFEDFLKKNVYAIKYGQGYSLVTSIDNNRKIGMKSGVVGTDAPTFTMTTEQTRSGIPKPESCTVTVHRMIDAHVGDFTATVYFDEYYKEGKTWDGKYTPSMWDTKPRTMLAKVAEMHALRKACPEELSQNYTEDELGKEKPVQAEVITPEKCALALEQATTLDELRDAWAKVPVPFKTQLESKKEEMKKKLSPAPVAPVVSDIEKLEKEIEAEEQRYNVNAEFPTDTDQFRKAHTAHGAKISEMKNKLAELKGANKTA